MLPVAELRAGGRLWRPPHGLAGAALWLSAWFVALWLISLLPWIKTPLVGWMQLLAGILLVGVCVPLAVRYVRRRVLWSVRSKLIVTYLLIGLAPVVLFVTLAGISAYVAAGQFSVHLADTRMHQELESLGAENAARTDRAARFLRLRERGELGGPPGRPGGPPGRRPGGGPGGRPAQRPADAQADTSATAAQTDAAAAQTLGESFPNPLRAKLHRHTSTYLNGAPLEGDAALPGFGPPSDSNVATAVPIGLPPWASDLKGRQFRGLVIDGDELFLVALDQRRIEPSGKLLTIITSMPVNSALVDVVAEGLGRVRFAAVMTNHRPATSSPTSKAESNTTRRSLGSDLQRTSTSGGVRAGGGQLRRPEGLDSCPRWTLRTGTRGSRITFRSRCTPGRRCCTGSCSDRRWAVSSPTTSVSGCWFCVCCSPSSRRWRCGVRHG